MATTNPVMRARGILSRLLFWGAFITFWILLAVLIQEALVSTEEEEKPRAQAVFELG